MKRQGTSRAFEAFNSKRSDTFRFGDLNVAVITLDGKLVANGDQPESIGVNLSNAKDEDGTLFVQEIIQKAKTGGGWVSYRIKNSFQSTYCELVEIGLEKFIIMVGLFPVSKQETTLLILKSAISVVKSMNILDALRALTKKNGTFIRGDLFVVVYNSAGVCLAAGNDFDRIWRNMLDAKDDTGKPYVRLLLNAVKRGPAKITYNFRNSRLLSFAEQVEKDGKIYMLVTGYFI